MNISVFAAYSCFLLPINFLGRFEKPKELVLIRPKKLN